MNPTLNLKRILLTAVLLLAITWLAVALGTDKNPVTLKQRVCPTAWIDNQMPQVYTTGKPLNEPSREYLVVNGKRAEIVDYDMGWIKNNCSIKKEIAS